MLCQTNPPHMFQQTGWNLLRLHLSLAALVPRVIVALLATSMIAMRAFFDSMLLVPQLHAQQFFQRRALATARGGSDAAKESERSKTWIYPTATKQPYWHISQRHGIHADGPFSNALRGFHCRRVYCIKTGPDLSPASLSAPYKPARGFGEGDGTSPWSWNILYSAIVRYALQRRRANAAQRGLQCGIPWRWKEHLELNSGWTRKNDDRACHQTQVEVTLFAASRTTPHCSGPTLSLNTADDRGPSGLDVFSTAVSEWGSREHMANGNGVLSAMPLMFAWLVAASCLKRQ